QARETVARAAYSLRMMHRGAALPRCDWGLGWEEEGLELLLPQGKGVHVLSSLACLRARMRFEGGRNAEAVADLLAARALGRHFAREGLNIMVLVGYTVEHRTGEALALYLPRLDARTVKGLRARLDALPPGGSPATAVKFEEKSALDWLVREAREAKDKDSLLALLGQFGEPPARARAVLEECGGTAAGLVKFAEQTRPSYRVMAKKLDLPLEQFEKEWEREKTKQAGNPLFKLAVPAFGRMRWQQARADVRRALLTAALAVQLDGRDALKNHPDPVVGGPFEYVPFKGGFELRSRWKLDEKLRAKWKLDERFARPLALTVGRRGQ